jgi:DNA modification methylase
LPRRLLSRPLALMRQLVQASLPLGSGIVLDPFMGGGSTVAAALAVGYDSIGVESDPAFFKIAERAIPQLVEFGRRTVPSSAAGMEPQLAAGFAQSRAMQGTG